MRTPEEGYQLRPRLLVGLLLTALAFAAWPLEAAATEGDEELVANDLSGTLYDGTTGVPITCGVVVLTPSEGGNPLVAVTNGLGGYFFEPLPPGSFSIRVNAFGYEELTPPAIAAPGNLPATRHFTLFPRGAGGVVSGRITDAGTGFGFAVAVAELWFDGVRVADAFACTDGRYELPLAALPAGVGAVPIEIRFSGQGALPESAILMVDPAVGAVVNRQLTIIFGSVVPANLVGAVRGRSGANAVPLPDAQITIRGPVSFTITTDANGLYTSLSIFPGRYTVTASAQGFRTQNRVRTLAQNEVGEASFDLEALDPADANRDGMVNAVDVQLAINAALGITLAQGLNADINGDGFVNAVDVQLVINAALGVTTNP